MKRNTLVYGLSKDYIENMQWINTHYEVTGACDQDETRLPANIGIRKCELKDKINNFETILITADPVSIIDDLINEFSVSLEKIEVLYYEIDKERNSIISFYGNDNEDAALLLLAEKLGYTNQDVKYLEIGTNDPMRFNNTYNFYLRNNNGGYIIDPLPGVGYLAKLLRPKDKFIHAAVSDTSANAISFFACKSSTVSSLDKSHHKEWDGQSHNEVTEIKIPLLGINDILAQINYIPDLLIIDAEGEDEKIIRAIDYKKYKPKIIMVEVNHINDTVDNLINFMNNKGYIEYSTLQQNMIFVIKEEAKKL